MGTAKVTIYMSMWVLEIVQSLDARMFCVLTPVNVTAGKCKLARLAIM